MEHLVRVLMLTVLAVGPTDRVTGIWKTVDEKTGTVVSTVQVYEQDGKISAKITSLPEPNDAQNKPRICTKCAGADKDRPVVGLVIVKDLAARDGRYKGGTIIDPADGKVYKAEMWIEDGKLKVRGYLGALYKTQTWLRAS